MNPTKNEKNLQKVIINAMKINAPEIITKYIIPEEDRRLEILKKRFFEKGFTDTKNLLWTWTIDDNRPINFKEFSKMITLISSLHKKFPDL